MDAILIALGSALALLAAASLGQGWAQRRRAHRLAARLELIPNVLLSRWPIAFASGPRSAFWRADYWSFAPRFLAEHGYETLALDLPWRGEGARANALRGSLAALPRPCHLIFDAASRSLAEEAASWRHAGVASVTVVASAPAPKRAEVNRGMTAARSAAELRPSTDAVYELNVARPRGPRRATFEGRLARASFALHAAAMALRGGRGPRPRPEEVAVFDESFEVERQLLAHAISLAENDCR